MRTRRSRTHEPDRFRRMTAAAGRNRDASRTAVEIMRAAARVSRVIDVAPAVADLTLPQFNILMEPAGLVAKSREDHDARVVQLALTDGGWAALERAMPHVFSAEIELLSDYTRDERRDIVQLLGSLTATAR